MPLVSMDDNHLLNCVSHLPKWDIRGALMAPSLAHFCPIFPRAQNALCLQWETAHMTFIVKQFKL